MMDQAQHLRNAVRKKNNGRSGNVARVVTVTSGKGGVGKSNFSVNLAVQLSKMGKRVVIFDADFGLANVEVMFGAIPKYNISDFIYNGKAIEEIITPGPMDIGFISGGSGIIGLNNLYHEQIEYLVRAIDILNDVADFIIIDTGAGISDQVIEFVMASPEVLLISTPDPSSLADAYSLLKTLYRNPNFSDKVTKINVVSNRVSSPEEGQAVYDKLSSVVAQFLHGSINYLGMVPQDSAVERAVRTQKPVSITEPDSNAARAFEVVTGNLLNGTHDEIQMRLSISQIFMNFLTKHSSSK